MKTKIEWDQDITKITQTIHQEFPELTKYICEIPIKSSANGEISVESLKDYYFSLEELISNYSKTH
jgi:hypothetical protein